MTEPHVLRCQDCLEDFTPDSRRFAVIKDDDSGGAPVGYHVIVCLDCAEWYGDEAVEITEAA